MAGKSKKATKGSAPPPQPPSPPASPPPAPTSRRARIRKELRDLNVSGIELVASFQKKEKLENSDFPHSYQTWYTKALPAVGSIAPDRLAEFKSYYEIDPKRKSLGYGTYVIQDYLKGVVPNRLQYPDFDSRTQTAQAFYNQLTLLQSLTERIDSSLANIEGQLFADIQDSELAVAKELSKLSLRAAGALAGVIIEGHLQRVAHHHAVKITKKHPTIAELNDALKAASVYETPAWRKVTYLGDLRNICCHAKGVEPTKEQVAELLDGCEWMAKTLN